MHPSAVSRPHRRPRPLRPAGHVRELGEHLASAGRLPGLVPSPSSWCSPAAVGLASPDPLPRLDVLGTGQSRPLRPAARSGLVAFFLVPPEVQDERANHCKNRKKNWFSQEEKCIEYQCFTDTLWFPSSPNETSRKRQIRKGLAFFLARILPESGLAGSGVG